MSSESAAYSPQRLEQPNHHVVPRGEKQESRRGPLERFFCRKRRGLEAEWRAQGCIRRSPAPAARHTRRTGPPASRQQHQTGAAAVTRRRRRAPSSFARSAQGRHAAIGGARDEPQSDRTAGVTCGRRATPPADVTPDSARLLQAARVLTDQLSPPLVAELGLRLAVQCIIASFSERTGTTITCETEDCPRLSDVVEWRCCVRRGLLEHLDPLATMPSIALLAGRGAVELHVRPLPLGVAVRWKDRVLLQFGTAIRVRMVAVPKPARQRSSARVELVVAAKSGVPARL